MREVLALIGYPEPALGIRRELGQYGYQTKLVFTCQEMEEIIGVPGGTDTDALILGSDIISAFPVEVRHLMKEVYRRNYPIPVITCIMRSELRMPLEVENLAEQGDYVIDYFRGPRDLYFAFRCLESHSSPSILLRMHEMHLDSLQARNLRSAASKL